MTLRENNLLFCQAGYNNVLYYSYLLNLVVSRDVVQLSALRQQIAQNHEAMNNLQNELRVYEQLYRVHDTQGN